MNEFENLREILIDARELYSAVLDESLTRRQSIKALYRAGVKLTEGIDMVHKMQFSKSPAPSGEALTLGICRTCDTDIEHDGFKWNHALKILDAEHTPRPKGTGKASRAEVDR